jgi:homocysteine S-methyltransferase
MTFRDELVTSPLVLDGGMATSLEELGHDLSGHLWSAKILLEDPTAIFQVHQNHIAAGADVITTASYQISNYGFAKIGRSKADVQTAIKSSVELARRAADQADRKIWVAASIGPYGAVLADGSEYRGDYKISYSELRTFHLERLKIFADAEPDLFAFETIPCQLEIDVINDILQTEFTNTPAWISVSAKNESEISDGTDIKNVFDKMAANVVAVGVNCTKPEFITPLIQRIESSLPKVVYPNAGRTWDAKSRCWRDAGTNRIAESELRSWVLAGARLIGGCCGLAEAQIESVAKALSA